MKYLLWIILIILVLIGIYLIWPKPVTDNSSVIEEKIDSLQTEINHLYDLRSSSRDRIDTVYMQLKEVNNYYETLRTNILDNTVNDDYEFFTGYLNKRWGSNIE